MTFKQYFESKRNNSHLAKAKNAKDDEFYISYENARKMIMPFAKNLDGKSILCNCDSPDYSQTFKFLKDNFSAFNIRRLVAIGFGSYMQIVTKNNVENIENLKNNGDFRTGESVDALKRCDVVVSNPPFSDNMFIDFINLAMEYSKDLLCIGPLDGAKAKDVKKYLISGRLNAIKSPFEEFNRPDSSEKNAKVAIYTTFDDDPFGKEITLNNNVEISNLPVEDNTGIHASIGKNGSFSILQIPVARKGDLIVVPLHILRKKWKHVFRMKDILNTVHCNGKNYMSGIVMEYV